MLRRIIDRYHHAIARPQARSPRPHERSVSAAGVRGLSKVAAKAEFIRIRRASDYLGE
jgi:hypothetical protein